MLLPNAIEYTDHLNISLQQNMLTFEFSGLNYSNPNHLYAYQMEGITNDNEWIYSSFDNRRATFTLLRPGDYTFRVKSGWDENSWSKHVRELTITVHPPWWRTNWAFTVYSIFLLSLLISLYKIRTHRLRLRSVELESQVELRTDEITERNKEIVSQKNLIEHLLDKKNEMFANISHELRTPLTLIKGPLRNIKSLTDDPETNHSLEIAERNTQRLTVLVEQLLSLSKAQQFENADNVPLVKHYLSQIAIQLCESFQPIADVNQIAFQYEIEPELSIMAVEHSPEDILINILSNAFKYTPIGKSITLKINAIDNDVVINITDTGIGIAPDQLDTISQRFTRQAQQHENKVEGVGLGLALVKQLVELHKWNLNVSSLLNQGSNFEILIPVTTGTSTACVSPSVYQPSKQTDSLAKETHKQMEYLQQVLSIRKSNLLYEKRTFSKTENKHRVLIIDDTEDMLHYLGDILLPIFDCLFAKNGKQGLQLAKAQTPDLVVCDVMMPALSGYDVLDQLRNDLLTSHIPILLLTARGDKQSRLKGLSKLADDYITKPFDADELKARIQSVLSLMSLRQDSLTKLLLGAVNVNKTENAYFQLTPKDQAFVEKWKKIVERNYSDTEIKIEILAGCMHLSTGHLLDKLKALTGKGPKDFLDEYRLVKASDLLKSSSHSIAIIADAVGFKEQSYFSKRFKSKFYLTPSQYRKSRLVGKIVV
jgi:signal transduction histidine kinase/DNA-binding NarL/FixJ family response regulator